MDSKALAKQKARNLAYQRQFNLPEDEVLVDGRERSRKRTGASERSVESYGYPSSYSTCLHILLFVLFRSFFSRICMCPPTKDSLTREIIYFTKLCMLLFEYFRIGNNCQYTHSHSRHR